jgi:hypothetical protein
MQMQKKMLEVPKILGRSIENVVQAVVGCGDSLLQRGARSEAHLLRLLHNKAARPIFHIMMQSAVLLC